MTQRGYLTVEPFLSLYCENISIYKQNYLFAIICIRGKVVPKHLKIMAGYASNRFIIVYLRNYFVFKPICRRKYKTQQTTFRACVCVFVRAACVLVPPRFPYTAATSYDPNYAYRDPQKHLSDWLTGTTCLFSLWPLLHERLSVCYSSKTNRFSKTID